MKQTSKQLLTNYYSSDSLTGEYREQFAQTRALVRMVGGLCAGALVALIVTARNHPLVVLVFMVMMLVGLISLRAWEYKTFNKLREANRHEKFKGAVENLGELTKSAKENK